jgi:hypothetical protein
MPANTQNDTLRIRAAAGGGVRHHIETIQGIDALNGIAEAEAIKGISRIDRAA